MEDDNTHEQLATLERLKRVYDYALIVLVASAGAGKTTLLRNWADGCRWPVAWVTLGPVHNRPGRFLNEVFSALNRTGLDLNYDAPVSIPDETVDDAIVELINAIVQRPGHLALVLDNYQVITSAAIHRGMMLLIDYAPPQLHLVIASRTEPPLQLPRLRVRRQLLKLTMDN